MALSIPTDRPLRSPRQLLELVEAIHNASDHDENDWIEWKSNYDLTKKEVKATLARHIIGIANRMPEKSAAICQGYGYIVIGVEPGKVEGVASIDLADLDSGLQPYLGHQGPEWSASYVSFHGRTILVMTIEPPKTGDPIHTLNREFANYVAGMIFVRRSARTVQANPGEVLSLTRRATQSTPTQQNMTVISEDEPVEFHLWGFSDHIDQQCRQREEQLLSPQRMTRRSNSLGMTNMDSRNEKDYREEVGEYLEEYREFLMDIASQAYVKKGYGKLQLTVSNPDQNSHQGVRVELSFSAQLRVILADDYAEEEFSPPYPPKPLGTMLSVFMNPNALKSIQPQYRGPSEMETAVEAGSVVFNIASVRAEGQVKLPTIHFTADSWSGDEGIITWAITALNSGGRAKGSIQVNQVGVATIAPRDKDSRVSES